MYPVDRITYEQISQLKNPLLRTALLNANLQLHAENMQGIETVLDNWPGNDKGFEEIRRHRDNAAQVVENLSVITRYLGDAADAGLYKYYKQANIYDSVQTLMKTVFADENMDIDTRKTALGVLFQQGSLFEGQGEGTARRADAVAAIAAEMARGLQQGGPSAKTENIDWEDPRNRPDKDMASLRIDMLTTALPYLAETHPEYIKDVYKIVSDAAEKDIHAAVRRTAVSTLSILALIAGPEKTELLQNIRDVFEHVSASDPNAVVSNHAKKVILDLPQAKP